MLELLKKIKKLFGSDPVAVAKKVEEVVKPDPKKERKEQILKKKKEAAIHQTMELTGWDEAYATAKFEDAYKRTKCTPKEYVMYRFYEIPEEKQETYYLSCYQHILQEKYNANKKFTKMLYDKEQTNLYFAEYVRRPWCVNTKVTKEEFMEIFKNSKRVIYKPNAGHRGYGVKAFYLRKKTIDEVYEKLSTYPEGVVEEYIIQHPEMSKLSPSSVNSLRFVTISSNTKAVTPDGKKMDVAYSMVRIGRGKSIVDNLHSGGMVANVDMATGMLETNGADRDGKMYTEHPETHIVLKGFKVPYFEEALDMVKEAIEKYKVEGYIGWDIAITEDGPKLLEVNDRPGADGLQTAYAQEYIGVKHVMEKYL